MLCDPFDNSLIKTFDILGARKLDFWFGALYLFKWLLGSLGAFSLFLSFQNFVAPASRPSTRSESSVLELVRCPFIDEYCRY